MRQQGAQQSDDGCRSTLPQECSDDDQLGSCISVVPPGLNFPNQKQIVLASRCHPHTRGESELKCSALTVSSD